MMLLFDLFFFFFNDTATTEIYTLSLHDALPICRCSPTWADQRRCSAASPRMPPPSRGLRRAPPSSAAAPIKRADRKSTRLNSSHDQISYAVFCLKKKKNRRNDILSDCQSASVAG